jgi:hypothetical protein
MCWQGLLLPHFFQPYSFLIPHQFQWSLNSISILVFVRDFRWLTCPKWTACYLGPEARICKYLVALDRKHSEVSKTVKIMSVCYHRQRAVRSAECITGGKLPALQDTYGTRYHRNAKKIIKDNNHQSHCLFTPLSYRRRGQYRCIKAGETEKQLLSQGHQTVKQPSLTLSGCCQHTDSTPATLIMEKMM